MNRAFPFTDKLPAFQRADVAWGDELRRVFGKDACNARYQPRGKGEPGTELHRLHEAREAARAAWHQSATN